MCSRFDYLGAFGSVRQTFHYFCILNPFGKDSLFGKWLIYSSTSAPFTTGASPCSKAFIRVEEVDTAFLQIKPRTMSADIDNFLYCFLSFEMMNRPIIPYLMIRLSGPSQQMCVYIIYTPNLRLALAVLVRKGSRAALEGVLGEHYGVV